ncbi:uncharacterized protein I206_104741 [Kwoniella pini CBS 10737]|uniref:Uncharacterized protein n=1 Tax=Kwoniella pini CBS 10737 TaxID=1296096 RepID=A0A1B9I7U3_9TREE|nr:uncharacterized protein I206_02279 [Kwoniella pini CBS 10737]OCF51564.1 hypothetical protein I206_02279 [Kwoniella pini CBS 10737]
MSGYWRYEIHWVDDKFETTFISTTRKFESIPSSFFFFPEVVHDFIRAGAHHQAVTALHYGYCYFKDGTTRGLYKNWEEYRSSFPPDMVNPDPNSTLINVYLGKEVNLRKLYERDNKIGGKAEPSELLASNSIERPAKPMEEEENSSDTQDNSPIEPISYTNLEDDGDRCTSKVPITQKLGSDTTDAHSPQTEIKPPCARQRPIKVDDHRGLYRRAPFLEMFKTDDVKVSKNDGNQVGELKQIQKSSVFEHLEKSTIDSTLGVEKSSLPNISRVARVSAGDTPEASPELAQISLPNIWSMSPEEHRWNFYADSHGKAAEEEQLNVKQVKDRLEARKHKPSGGIRSSPDPHTAPVVPEVAKVIATVNDDHLVEQSCSPTDTTNKPIGILLSPEHVNTYRISTYGFKLEETFDSQSATPSHDTVKADSESDLESRGIKALPPIPTKQLPTPPFVSNADDDVPSAEVEVLARPQLERVTSRDYLDDLVDGSGNTTASNRLLRIMQAENVSPASSLGLKLLDLAQALRVDGELAPSKPEPQIDNTTSKKVDVIENRLNDFADMLNHIAETVGVNFERSSTAPSSPSFSASSGDNAEEVDSTAATPGESPPLLDLSQLAVSSRQVNEKLDAITSPRDSLAESSSSSTHQSPVISDLAGLVKKAQKLEEEEDELSQTSTVENDINIQAASAHVVEGRALPDSAKSGPHLRSPQDRSASTHPLYPFPPQEKRWIRPISPFAIPPQFGYSYKPFNDRTAAVSTQTYTENLHNHMMNPMPMPPSTGYATYYPNNMNQWRHLPGTQQSELSGGFSQYSQANPYNGIQYQNSIFNHHTNEPGPAGGMFGNFPTTQARVQQIGNIWERFQGSSKWPIDR